LDPGKEGNRNTFIDASADRFAWQKNTAAAPASEPRKRKGPSAHAGPFPQAQQLNIRSLHDLRCVFDARRQFHGQRNLAPVSQHAIFAVLASSCDASFCRKSPKLSTVRH